MLFNKNTKYHSKKVLCDGIAFDSKAERDYYLYLKALEKAHEVKEFLLQPEIVLQEGFTYEGKRYRAITYTPDFLVTYPDGRQEYVDVKGFSTQQGEIKRKLYLFKGKIPLRWVAPSKKYSKTGWLDYDELRRLRRQAKRARES